MIILKFIYYYILLYISKCQGRLQDFAHGSRQVKHLFHGSEDQVLPQDWVGCITKYPVLLCLQIISNIDKELAWLLPILASDERIKYQIFVLDKMTEDLIGEQ